MLSARTSYVYFTPFAYFTAFASLSGEFACKLAVYAVLDLFR